MRLASFGLALLVASGLGASAAAGAPVDGMTVGQPATDCGDPENAFGRALAAAGRRLLVGAPGEVCGFAHLLDARTGRELRQLRSPLHQEGNAFGAGVGMLGTRTALVTAPNENAAYAFDADDGSLRATFTVPVPQGIGRAIAGAGARVVVGGYTVDGLGTTRGAAYVFDDTGTFERAIGVDASAASLAWSLASLDDRRVVIGAPFGYRDSAGAAFVADVTTGALGQPLRAPSPAPGDWFGFAVAADDGIVAVGAPSGTGGAVGAVHLFDARSRRLLRTVTDPVGLPREGFGEAVAIKGRKLLVGAPNHSEHEPGLLDGAAYLFDARSGALRGRFYFGGDYQAGSGASVAFLHRGIAVGVPYLDRGLVRLQLRLPH